MLAGAINAMNLALQDLRSCLQTRVAFLLAACIGVVLRAADAPAPPGHGLVTLRNGSRLAGTVLNDSFTLRTAYGSLKVLVSAIDRMEMADVPGAVDALYGIGGDRFSGFIEDPVVLVKLDDGGRTVARRERVRRIAFPGREKQVLTLPPWQMVVLRNGDYFHSKLAGDRWRLVSKQGDVSVSADDLDMIEFAEPPDRTVRVVDRKGGVLRGTWPDEDIEIDTAVGPRLKVHLAFISSLHFSRASVPGEIASKSALAREAGASSAASEPPSGFAPDDMVWIKPGQFLMGSPREETGRDLDEGPQTQVALTQGFWMATHEVTQGEYQAVMGSVPSVFTGDSRLPVERVTWLEAVDYCRRLTAKHSADGRIPSGHVYRLPSEAEWEYACRAGTTTRFSFGDDPELRRLAEYAWHGEVSDSTPHSVATKKPNPWGLYDMHGNVLEWCLDGATTHLPGGTVTNYRAPADGSLRIARGGSWLYGAKSCRSANRDSYSETTRCSDLGFRVVLAPAEQL
jgi:formylglycine-generating enzyme required for sulfatase activity